MTMTSFHMPVMLLQVSVYTALLQHNNDYAKVYVQLVVVSQVCSCLCGTSVICALLWGVQLAIYPSSSCALVLYRDYIDIQG